jgi:glutamate racemase
MLVMDSGLGGISVVRAMRALAPGRSLTYLADTAGFPYGNRSAAEIATRAETLIRQLHMQQELSSVVLACNTLSTLCLDALRARFAFAFVGTVPAIKVAAARSRSKRFTLLATPNTAQSDYSRALIAQFASGCTVDCYGAPNLAPYAERILLGEEIDAGLLRAELAPAFHDGTDSIVLGCTHYPLIAEQLCAVAPWEVAWIDSSDAIARRALSLADAPPERSIAYVTRAGDVARYRDIFSREGFDETRALTAP